MSLDTELPPDETDAESLTRNIDAPIVGIRREIAGIREVLNRLGQRHPQISSSITDINFHCMAMLTHTASLEETVAARRAAGKEAAKKRQERPEHYELAFEAMAPVVKELTPRERERMLQSLHAAGDNSLDEEGAA